jgi:hypothetical protein
MKPSTCSCWTCGGTMVVRNAEREFVNPEGKTFNMSLSNTCLDCHSNKAEFCDRVTTTRR